MTDRREERRGLSLKGGQLWIRLLIAADFLGGAAIAVFGGGRRAFEAFVLVGAVPIALFLLREAVAAANPDGQPFSRSSACG